MPLQAPKKLSQGNAFYKMKKLLLVGASEVAIGCEYKDCIPPLDDPKFISSQEAAEWLSSEDLVLGLTLGEQAKAYPLRILNYHEIVNDDLAGEPIVVSYCPLCNSGVVFKRRVGGRVLDFGVSGMLYHSNLVLYDRQTETFWAQLSGEAIAGPLVTEVLDRLPADIVTWEAWQHSHPDTLVLSRETGYERDYDHDPYGPYKESPYVYFETTFTDERLHPKADVIGLMVEGATKAYPRELFTQQPLLHDELGGVPVLLVQDAHSQMIRAFDRRVGERVLQFEMEGDGLRDLGTSSLWSFEGEALKGELAGRQLRELSLIPTFWFAWVAYHPETALFSSVSPSQSHRTTLWSYGLYLVPPLVALGWLGYLFYRQRRRKLLSPS